MIQQHIKYTDFYFIFLLYYSYEYDYIIIIIIQRHLLGPHRIGLVPLQPALFLTPGIFTTGGKKIIIILIIKQSAQ